MATLQEKRIFLTCEGIPGVKLPVPPSQCCAKFPHYPGRVMHCKAHCEFYKARELNRLLEQSPKHTVEIEGRTYKLSGDTSQFINRWGSKK